MLVEAEAVSTVPKFCPWDLRLLPGTNRYYSKSHANAFGTTMNGWKIISRFPVPPYTRRIGWWLCTIFLTANVSTFKVGLGISRTNADSHGIRFSRHCIEFFVVKTKWFVRSNVNVILTLQNSSQYSSRAAGSKRIALQIYFYERVCHMFLMSRCRGGWDLWLCTFFGYLRKDNRCTMPNSNFFPRAKHFFFRKLPLRSGSLYASTQIK